MRPSPPVRPLDRHTGGGSAPPTTRAHHVLARGRLALALTVLAAVLGALVPAATATAASVQGSSDWRWTSGVRSNGTPPTVYAKAWVLADLTTGEVLAERHAHWHLRPASTLKTLTADTLLPRLDPDQVYRVQYEDAAVEGSAVGIVPGATYTVDQLWYGLMLPSGNDAAHALAGAAGGMHHTVHLMQQQAEYLHADDTTVRNSSGLDAPGQFTSAYDLALFTQAGMERADFRNYVSTTSYAFPAGMPKHGKKRKTYMIYNQNPLLFDYRGAVGVKTGYTTLAGRTFVGAARRHGHLLVATAMGIIEPSEDAAAKLLTWGFRQLGSLEPVGHLAQPGEPAAKHQGQNVLSAASPPATVTPASAHANGISSFWVAMGVLALGAVVALLVLAFMSRRSHHAGRDRRTGTEKVPFAFKD
jgi:serine-type D-Ala-D-Ala carboxypeptidase (penicillin-binding protein 5/6)